MIKCKPNRDSDGYLNECYEKGNCIGECMYMTLCQDCDIPLDIKTHIFIMNNRSKEKTICSDCFGGYTIDNNDGWYDDENQLLDMRNEYEMKKKEDKKVNSNLLKSGDRDKGYWDFIEINDEKIFGYFRKNKKGELTMFRTDKK